MLNNTAQPLVCAITRGRNVVDTISKLIEAAKNLLSFLTLSKLAMLLIAGIIGIFLFVLFERRAAFSEYADAMLKASRFDSANLVLIKLSVDSEASLKNYVISDPNIAAIQVVTTDVPRMNKDTVFFHSKRRELQQDFETFRDNKKSPTQLLEQGDTDENLRFIAIINQEFVCVPPTTKMVQALPSVGKYAKQVCSISVPPRFGDMVGFVNFYLVEPLDGSNKGYYHHLARLVADAIYKRDIVRRQNP